MNRYMYGFYFTKSISLENLYKDCPFLAKVTRQVIRRDAQLSLKEQQQMKKRYERKDKKRLKRAKAQQEVDKKNALITPTPTD